MRLKPPLLAVLLLLVTPLFPQTENHSQLPDQVAIFAVNGEDKSLSIYPIVIVHYGPGQGSKKTPAFDEPLPSRDTTQADFDEIEQNLYKPGSVVSVFSGGEKIGTATVGTSHIEGRDGGCVNLSADISYPGRGSPILAANSGIPGHSSTRHSATPAEILILRRLAEKWLLEYGLAPSLVRKSILGHVSSTELRKNAGRAIIGRLDVTSKRAIHRFFAVAERERNAYHLSLTNLEIQHDIEDGTDKTERSYIDQLDINNDGQDEIITSAAHYESWSYTVWQFYPHDHTWRKKFNGSGGGC